MQTRTFYYGAAISLLLLFNAYAGAAVTPPTKKTCVGNKCAKKYRYLLPASWKGSNAQLGIVYVTGNSKTTNINGGLNLNFSKEAWENVLNATAQLTTSDGITTQQQYFAQNQTNYHFGCNFIFANANYTQNRFSPYDYQFVGSVGYGRTLLDTHKTNLTLQLGPGIRRNSIKQTNQPSMTENHLIGTSALNLSWKITDTVVFTENITYNYGDPYDYLKTITALTNKIIRNLGVQISYTTEYYSRIPLNSSNNQNLNTTLNVSLVYSLA